jgi:segregation and condensation protein A
MAGGRPSSRAKGPQKPAFHPSVNDRTSSSADIGTPVSESENAPSENAPSENTSGQQERTEPAFDVRLDQFEGPLDLLLTLIRRQKINIYDIPIARITQQYLDYVRQAEQLNIDLGGEFVFMAATLIHIKSRLLLPADPLAAEEEQEDPRADLVRQLLEHEKYAQAAQMLREKRLIEENTWTRPPLDSFLEAGDEPELAVGIVDLVQTFEKVLERAKNRPTYEVAGEDVSVASRIQYLKNLLLSEDGPISLLDVFERQPNRRALLATFLAVLELVRMRAIVLRQKDLFGEIMIRKHKMFDTVFNDEESFYSVSQEYGE